LCRQIVMIVKISLYPAGFAITANAEDPAKKE
jgi:hypothetical protein